MIERDAVLGWIAIGLAASFAGMIWPFRKGMLGVAINTLVGASGAVAMALASYAVVPHPPGHDSTARLFFAAFGALSALVLAHILVLGRARRRGKRARSQAGLATNDLQ